MMSEVEIMEYLPIQEYSDKWNISKRRIQILCKEGRINGAKMIGNMWVIPENIERPSDARIKSPVIDSAKEESSVRRELKKLLKRLYDLCSQNGIPINFQKEYVLSVIASELATFYIGDSLDNKGRSIICRDITARRSAIKFDQEDTSLVKSFIYEFRNDPELDNILSWAYQYSNKFIKDNSFSKTQFFTEKYMIKFLIKNIKNITCAKKILDPCVGGGNFLVECLEYLCDRQKKITLDGVKMLCSRLYGFDIDNMIARIALVNIRLRAFAILKRNGISFDMSIWNEIVPNIYISSETDMIQGSLTKDHERLVSLANRDMITTAELFGENDVVVTNPPFATIKGMKQEEKEFLKKAYPASNCDTCVAFIEAIGRMLSSNGVCGIVSQSSWMHLKSFESFRNWVTDNYVIERIANLGSGAFQDLSGEKSNVSLIVFRKGKEKKSNDIRILNATEGSYEEKVKKVELEEYDIQKRIAEINGSNGFDFSENDILKELDGKTESYKDIAVPMQGTSTGNAKELVGYFWEHFGDPEWICVSNGGGYCRWQGLNDSVVRWGKDGEYIKAQKGSALRNVKYFPETQMVFSDTGTAGLNVRVLHDNQVFIASGPGIRIKKGNEYAHLALLNSRLASYCIRLMSPKLTIAAGYIGQIPVNDKISSSVVLVKNARLCVELKEKMLSTRATNIEYSDDYFSRLPHDIEKASWMLLNEDLTNELLKLEIESKIDSCIIDNFGFSEEAINTLAEKVGKCAYDISGSEDLDLTKLDKYLDKLLDSNCCLKRTKNSKSALGSDGYVEYLSKDLSINPEIIVRKIQDNPLKMERVLGKYRNLLLHNYVLYCMGYNTKSGVIKKKEKLTDIVKTFDKYFDKYEFETWIKKTFNDIHYDVFKGRPYLVYYKGEVCLNDQLFAK